MCFSQQGSQSGESRGASRVGVAEGGGGSEDCAKKAVETRTAVERGDANKNFGKNYQQMDKKKAEKGRAARGLGPIQVHNWKFLDKLSYIGVDLILWQICGICMLLSRIWIYS